MKKAAFVLVLFLFMVGCGNNNVTTTKEDTEPKTTSEQKQTSKVNNIPVASNLFDPLITKVDDSVNGLRVKSITVEKEYPGKDYPAEVEFTGQINLTGKVVYYDQSNEFLPDMLTFESNEESKNKIPRLAYDERNYWFAFSNQEEAAKLLGKKNSDNVTIVVDDYKVWYAHTEVCDLARLVIK